jgi:hypothetical protein
MRRVSSGCLSRSSLVTLCASPRSALARVTRSPSENPASTACSTSDGLMSRVTPAGSGPSAPASHIPYFPTSEGAVYYRWPRFCGSFLPADCQLGGIVRTWVAVATDVLLPGSLRVYRGRRSHQDESPIRFIRSGGGELRLPIPESPLAQAS